MPVLSTAIDDGFKFVFAGTAVFDLSPMNVTASVTVSVTYSPPTAVPSVGDASRFVK